LALAILCALVCTRVLADSDAPAPVDSAVSSESPDPQPSIRQQVRPADALAGLFPAATHIGFAVAVVPDPLVPRYRRSYDLQIAAIELGMLKDGYVLDRFSLPWDDSIRNVEDARRASPTDSKSATTGAPPASPSMEYRYGLMVFRCDAWRAGAGSSESSTPDSARPTCGAGNGQPRRPSGTLVRALYIVTDTATKGVEGEALLCAIDRINSQLSSTRAASAQKGCSPWSGTNPSGTADGASAASCSPEDCAALLEYPEACAPMQPGATLLVLGPNFSGGVDSVLEASKRMRVPTPDRAAGIRALCMLSSSATDATNQEVSGGHPITVGYRGLALQNNKKLLHIARLVGPLLDGQPSGSEEDPAKAWKKVAILAEASTYGYGTCGYSTSRAQPSDSDRDIVDALCESARILYFPANIADIRYGMQTQLQQQRRALTNPLQLQMPSEHLALDLGAENGSEYPESRQSALTSAGAQLALDRVFEVLRSRPPKIVIVVATDVRDRLFLFDELRKRLPYALLVDLDADNLIGHPDFLHATRGGLAVSSAELTTGLKTYGCETPPRETAADAPGPAGAANAAPTPGAASDSVALPPPGEVLARSHRHPLMSWSTDYQAILADTVSRVYDPSVDLSSTACATPEFESRRQAALHLITLEGLQRVSRAFPRKPADSRLASEASPPVWDRMRAALEPANYVRFDLAELSAPLLCAGAAWLLIAPLALPRPRSRVLDWSGVAPIDGALLFFCGLCGIALYWVANGVHSRDHDNLLSLWTVIILIVGVWGLFLCLRVLRRASFVRARILEQATPPSSFRNIRVPSLLALAAFLLALVPSRWHRLAETSFTSYLDLTDLEKLALDPGPGMAFLLLVALATLALLYAAVVLATSGGVVDRNSVVLRESQPASTEDKARARTHRPDLRGVLDLNPLGLLFVSAAAIIVFVLPDLISGDFRLTLFGPFASRLALLCITATTVAATLLTCNSVGLTRRITAMSRYLRSERRQPPGSGAQVETAEHPPRTQAHDPGQTANRWPAEPAAPRVFPLTPVAAKPSDGGSVARKLLREGALPSDGGASCNWSQLVSAWLYDGRNDTNHRTALFTLLATEISLLRWSLLGAVLCALASVGAVYLFPIEADQLLMFNLVLLAGVGALAGYAATAFERDGLLSHLLCNRPARKFSMPLFLLITLPFLALAVGLAIAEIPGVVDWGGGLLQLFGAFGLHP
jgi:hypothetical protein